MTRCPRSFGQRWGLRVDGGKSFAAGDDCNDDDGGPEVVRVYGAPDAPGHLLPPWAGGLPASAGNALPSDVALYVDDDRIAVAMTLQDPTAGPSDFADAVGPVFLVPGATEVFARRRCRGPRHRHRSRPSAVVP